jgi:hypothetical protein
MSMPGRSAAELKSIRDEFQRLLEGVAGIEAVSISKNEKQQLVLAVLVRDHLFASIELPAQFCNMPVVKQKTSNIYVN